MPSQDKALIHLSHVAFAFGHQQVHHDISCSIYPGEIVTILGPSGAGKTVLLKLMIGLHIAQQGTVTVLGKNLSRLNDDELREIRKNIGILFQGAALFDSLTVAENIAFPLREYGELDEEIIVETVKKKLALVGLTDTYKKLPGELSGGQRKRIGLARALALNPKVLLFDEPTTGLDPTSRRQIDKLIAQLRDEHGVTSVLVTHDMESAERLSNRLILVEGGVVRAEGDAEEMWERHPLVKSFKEGFWT